MFWELFSNNSEKRKRKEGMDEAIIEDGYVEVDFTILFCACLKFFILKYLDIQEERLCVGTYQKNMVSSLHKCHFPPLRERSLSRHRQLGRLSHWFLNPTWLALESPRRARREPSALKGTSQLRFPLKSCQSNPPEYTSGWHVPQAARKPEPQQEETPQYSVPSTPPLRAGGGVPLFATSRDRCGSWDICSRRRSHQLPECEGMEARGSCLHGTLSK